MAWDNDPVIRDLADYANKHKSKAVIAICFKGGGMFEVVSCGKTKGLCDDAKKVNDQIHKAIMDGDISIPFPLSV